MVLRYYSINKTPEDVVSEIRQMDKKHILPKDSFTYVPQIGLYFLMHGFKVEIVTFNPYLFTHKDKSKKNPLKSIERFYKRVKNKKVSQEIKIPTRFFAEFIKAGGKVTVKIPDEADIRAEIRSGHPIIACLTSNFLYPKAQDSRFNFHGNVITGIDERHVYANDPLGDKNGGRNKYAKEDFLFGVYASAYGAPDNASLIKIWRKPRTGRRKS